MRNTATARASRPSSSGRVRQGSFRYNSPAAIRSTTSATSVIGRVTDRATAKSSAASAPKISVAKIAVSRQASRRRRSTRSIEKNHVDAADRILARVANVRRENRQMKLRQTRRRHLFGVREEDAFAVRMRRRHRFGARPVPREETRVIEDFGFDEAFPVVEARKHGERRFLVEVPDRVSDRLGHGFRGDAPCLFEMPKVLAVVLVGEEHRVAAAGEQDARQRRQREPQ